MDVGSVAEYRDEHGEGQAEVGPALFLVSSKRNSSSSVTRLVPPTPKIKCPNARLLRGRCKSHDNEQYFMFPCKARDCEVCGPLTRLKHSRRIDYGISVLGETWFMVLTFPEVQAANPEFKSEAVRRVNNYLRWMQKELRYKFQHCKSWELQKSGRLHVNVIFDFPWGEWIPFQKFQAKWGGRVTWEKVTTPKRLSQYVTKVASDRPTEDSLGRYVVKAGYQALPREWGRRVTYSSGWPKELRASKHLVDWKIVGSRGTDIFKMKVLKGQLTEVAAGRWSEGARSCSCFDHVKSSSAENVFKVFPGSRLKE